MTESGMTTTSGSASPDAPPIEQKISISGPSPPTLDGAASALDPTMMVSGSFLAKAHSGPLPSPDSLAAYATVDPELPRLIVQRAQAEQAHRHKIENAIVQAQVDDGKARHRQVARGQVLGTVVALAFVVGAVYLGVNDHPLIAGGLVGATILGIVALIVTGERARRIESADQAPPDSN